MKKFDKAEDCPDRADHTESGLHESDYLGWHAWADQMADTHIQSCCPTCGFWSIWTPKITKASRSLMEKITVNPIEPRYFLRAIAGPDKDIENQDFQILIQVGDEFYNACPNTIRLDVESSSKVVMDMEVDLHDMIIDMPARLVNQKGGVSKARVRIVGEHEHSGQHALNSASDIEKVTADGEEIYAGSFILEADGETNGNNLTVHTLLPPSKDT